MPTELAWVVPLLPLAASVLITVWGRRLPQGGGWIAVLAGGASMVIALAFAAQVLSSQEDIKQSFTWFAAGDLQFRIGIYIDNLTALMLIVVSFVSFLVLVYSIAYMGREGDRLPRYYAEMSLFIASMLGLILADNYLVLYVFWELVGLCSYLLIGYWFERPTAAAAAIKAFLVTRVGDMFFLVGLLLLLINFKGLDFAALFALQPDAAQTQILTLASLFIFIGAMGKSAQFPLHIWLPEAMEGPTTVSALIHAATMVKAGVYLVARTLPLLTLAPENLLLIALIGGFTALLAASLATVNNDIKRVMAYSTISQLGYMFLGLGVGGFGYVVAHDAAGYTAGLFHLMNHAFFKALLFLGAGSVMHAMADRTDLRQMGALWPKLQITGTAMLVGALSNAGIPPTSGFWSKDELLAAAYASGSHESLLYAAWFFGMATVLLTAFYLMRMWFMAFGGKPRWPRDVHPHESPPLMTLPLIVLSILAFGSGFAIFGGFGTYIAFGEPHSITAAEILLTMTGNPWSWVAVALALLGIAAAYLIYGRGVDLSKYRSAWGRFIYTVLDNRYYLDHLASAIAERWVVSYARLIDLFDRVVIDGLVNLLGSGSWAAGQRLRRLVTGSVSDYATWVLGGIVALLMVYMFWR